MSSAAVRVEDVWKQFRLYHERNQSLKSTITRGRRSRFEEFWALQGIDFEIPHGESFGIIGSNGSGKSTLLKCLAGILVPDKGSITHNGRVVALLELGAGFHPELSGRENVYLNAAILGLSRTEIAKTFDAIVEFSGLEQFIDSPVKNFSSGMVVRLGFAVAAHVNPEILVIDEVLAVGDAAFQQRCYERIQEFHREGRTIILVSHGLAQVTQLCGQAAWIEKGRLRRLGPAIEVVSDYTGNSYQAVSKREGEIGERWGTGEAEITDVRVVDSQGNVTDSITSREWVSFTIEVDAQTRVDHPVVGLRISDIHGNTVFGTNTRRRGIEIPFLSGRQKFEFVVDSFNLLEGAYDLTVALSDQSEVREFDHWDRRVRFTVRQSGAFDEGIVSIGGSWTVSG